jgi:glycosyltransferase involved in cell wall biosynthesis
MLETHTTRVSICIPTYNSATTLGATLNSILSQTYQDLEILVVDNASEDNTVQVARQFVDPRIRIYKNETNLGGEGNFNQCIALAKGEYIAIYHSDDIYLNTMVARQVDFLERYADVGCVFTEAIIIDDDDVETGAILFPKELKARGESSLGICHLMRMLLRHANFLICPSVMVRRTVYEAGINGWRGELFRSSADLDVWLRIAKSYGVGFLPETLMKYRVGITQYSEKVRYQTDPADFFLVMDHYLKDEDLHALLRTVDLRNYRRLQRRDLVMRAANLFLLGRFTESTKLLSSFLTRNTLYESVFDKRSVIVLFLFFYLRLVNISFCRQVGQQALRYIKKGLKK